MNLPFELSPRPLRPETPLHGGRVYLVPPRSQAETAFTRQITKRLISMGAEPQIVMIGNENSLRDIDGPIILWGNLADSDGVKELYFAFLSATDCRYPGPGGYEVRTLLDPFGRGHNVIHLGYSDAEGFCLGSEHLLAQLAPLTPRLSDIRATALPMADFQVRQIREASFPPLDWMITADNNVTHKGYLGYLTGDESLRAESQETWRRICAYGVPPGDHNVKDLHLRTSMLVSLFRLQESAGMIEDALRGKIMQFFLTWVYSDQGLEHLNDPECIAPRVQRQNHGTIPALALAYLGSYLRDFYPERKEPDEWNVVIDQVFAPYADGSWKSASEGICHGWWLEQPVLLEYGLIDKEHRFFKHGGAKRAADCAVAVVNNFGWLPSSGDVNLLRAFPGSSLRIAAAWYRDPRYPFVHQLAPEYRGLRMHQFLVRTFDLGVEGERPETGLTVVPLDPLVHEAASSERHDVAPWMFETAPSAPVEQCFDKVAFRAGWTPDDAYLLIDGIGGGSHAYADALDVIEYSRLGFTFLVSETGPKFPETDNHSVVTVARDGACQPIPCFAEQEACTWDAATGTGYARLVLRENNGGTWTRELFFLGKNGLVIHDHVRAEAAGDFTIQCNLRIPGKVSQDMGRVISRRKKENGEEVIFGLQPIVSESASWQVVEMDHSIHVRENIGQNKPPPEDDGVKAWSERYGTEDTVVNIVRSRIHTRLNVGEGVSFLHYAHARRVSAMDPTMRLDANGRIVIPGLPPLSSHLKLEFNPPSKMSAGESEVIASPAKAVFKLAEGTVQQIVPLADGGAAILGTDGRIVLCDREWQPRAELTVSVPIHDADADGERLYVGHGAASLSAINLTDRSMAWSREIERIPSSCSWWEWLTPSILRVVAARSQSGFDGVVVGCGDIHARRFTAAGTCLWAVRYVNGIPGSIGLMDVNGDGIDEIILGGEVMSNCAHCRVHNLHGELLFDQEVEGWTSRMTVLALSDGVIKYAALGVTRGKNLHFLEVGAKPGEPLKRLWVRRLPGTTTAIVIEAELERLLVGNSIGLLLCFDFKGEQRGRLTLSSGIQRIMQIKAGYLIGLEDETAIWIQVDAQGQLRITGRSALHGNWLKAVQTNAGIFLPTAGKVILLNPT